MILCFTSGGRASSVSKIGIPLPGVAASSAARRVHDALLRGSAGGDGGGQLCNCSCAGHGGEAEYCQKGEEERRRGCQQRARGPRWRKRCPSRWEGRLYGWKSIQRRFSMLAKYETTGSVGERMERRLSHLETLVGRS